MTVTGVWSRKPRPAAHCNWAGAPPRTVPAVQVQAQVQVQVQSSLISHPIAIASRLPVRVIASFPCTPMWLLHTNSPSASTVHHPPAPTARAAGSMRERGQERAEQGKGRSCHGTVAFEGTETRPRRTDGAPFAGCCHRHRRRCAVPGRRRGWEAGGRGFWAMRRRRQGWGLRLAASHSRNSSPIARLCRPSPSRCSPHSIRSLPSQCAASDTALGGALRTNAVRWLP